jgi:hypothetical protein
LRKSLIIVLLLVILSACSNNTNPTSTKVSPTITATPDLAREEELVYAALLQDNYSSDLYVLMNLTQTDVIGLADNDTFQRIEKSLTDLEPETLADFKSRNEESHTLKTSMILGSQYILMSKEDMQSLFGENKNGWDIFYNRYPEVPGIITFSKVGFNQAVDQALVYLGIQSHWLAGSGTYFLMVKKGGTWIIDQSTMTWIS